MKLVNVILAPLLAIALTSPAAAKAPQEINIFAWQVTKNGAKPDILVGTMHVAVSGGKMLPASLLSKLRLASRFAMEVDLTSVNPATVSKYLTLGPEDSLKKQMKPAAWNKLTTLGAKHGLSAQQMDHLAPWYIGMAFLDISPPQDELMDAKLRSEADKSQLPDTFFESAEEQFQALASVSRKEELAQLQELLDHPDQPKKEFEQLQKAYMSGNLKALEHLLFDPERVKLYPDFYKKLFYDRNARWIPRLTKLLEKDDAFVAVGLGHLLGPKGLLAALRRDGYTVEPLKL